MGLYRHGVLWFRPQLATPDEARVTALETHVRALHDEAETRRQELRELTHAVQQLRQDELRRQAEHTSVVDQLNRLYRRMAARVAREADATVNGNHEESVADMRRRLNR